MGMFDGVENAEGSDRNGFFLEGRYLARIVKFKGGKRRNDNLPYVAADFDVVTSTNPEIKPGTRRSWWCGIKKDTPALANIRDFVAAASQVDPKEVDNASCEMAVSEEQPLAGEFVEIICTNITKKNGDPFTKHVFQVPKLDEKELKRLLAAAGLPETV